MPDDGAIREAHLFWSLEEEQDAVNAAAWTNSVDRYSIEMESLLSRVLGDDQHTYGYPQEGAPTRRFLAEHADHP